MTEGSTRWGPTPYPVGAVAGWLAAWRAAAVEADRDLQDHVAELVGAADEQTELTRRWLTVDWLIRAATPWWLRAAGLPADAASLRGLPPLGSPQALADAVATTRPAAQAAYQVHEMSWHEVADRAQADASPGRSEIWLAVIDGSRLAAESVDVVLRPAAHTTGFPTGSGRGPEAWQHATAAITHSAGALTCSATIDAVAQPGWSWHQTPSRARALIYLTARAALAAPQAATLGAAHELLAAMHTTTPQRKPDV